MKAQQVSWEESEWLCPLHNALEPPHMPLTQVACALSLYLLAGPVGPLRGYSNSPRSIGLREATGHLLIHSRDEWISGELSQLPQALSERRPDRWEPLEKPPATACVASRRPAAHPALADREADTKDAKGANRHLKIHTPSLGRCLG